MINGYKIAAVCTSKVHEEYIKNFLNEFNKVLTENGWRVFVYTVNSDLYHNTPSDTGEAAVFDLIDYDRVDAVVLLANSIHDRNVTDRILENTEKNGIRLVMIDSYRPGCINLMFDYKNGFANIVKHIIDDHGVRDIRMIAGIEGNESSDIRIAALKELTAVRGIDFGDDRIYYGDFWSRPTIRACEEIIASGDLPEAIICANDTMAIAVCSTLKKHGIRVPEDVKVTGFDGIEEGKYTAPRISTVKCDLGKMGRAGAETLLDESIRVKDIYIMPDIIPAASCGCKCNNENNVSDILNEYWDMFDRYRNDERKLNIISSRVQVCGSIDDVEKVLKDRVFYELTCVLKKECTDPSYDPLCVNTDTTFGKNMEILFDSEDTYIGKDRSLDISDIIPRLGDILERKIPLIFTSVHFIDIPLGYLCFYFLDPGRDEYNKISQSSGYISAAFSGYRNMRYQNRLREWIEEVYKYDELTGLYTRKSFCREYDRMIKEDGCKSMTFVLCDLDGLKYINDNFGHSEGDIAIRVVAKAMELACENGICSKHGGDELLGAIPGMHDVKKLQSKIEKFIDDYNEASCKPYKVSSSIGIYVSDGDISFMKMFSEADDLMYIDKMRKKNNRSSDIQ